MNGWAMYYRHHGAIHYLKENWSSLCGHWKVRPEEQDKIWQPENPRESKKCNVCIKLLANISQKESTK